MSDITSETQLERGWEHYKKGEYRLAIDQLRAATRAKNHAHLVHFRLGFCFRALSLDDEALSEFETAAALQPQQVWYHVQAGKQLIRCKRHLEAISHYALGIEADPLIPDPYVDVGHCLAILNYFDLAVALYTMAGVMLDVARALGRDPGMTAVQYAVTMTNLERIVGSQKYADIRAQVHEALDMEDDPDVPDFQVDSGRINQFSREIVAALRVVTKSQKR